ncbi:MAG: phosphatase PAP2 family protein [Patescibacteria group bacterium]
MDYNITHFFNHLGSGTIIDNFSFYISWIPFLIAFWLLLALTALIWDRKNGKWIFLGTILILIIYFVLNDIVIKPTLASFIFRDRPYIAYPNGIISSGELWVDSSFPSGHMAITASLLTLYVYFYRKWFVYIFAGLFLFLMAFSRMHNGMHYPTDILAGILFGVGYGFLSILIIKKIKTKVLRAN